MNILDYVYEKELTSLRYVWTRLDSNPDRPQHSAFCEYASGTLRFSDGFDAIRVRPPSLVDTSVTTWSSMKIESGQFSGLPAGDPSTWTISSKGRLEIVGSDCIVKYTTTINPDHPYVYSFDVTEG